MADRRIDSIVDYAVSAAKRRGDATVTPAHLLAGMQAKDGARFATLFGDGAAGQLTTLLGPSGKHLGAPTMAPETTELLASVTDEEQLIEKLKAVLAGGGAAVVTAAGSEAIEDKVDETATTATETAPATETVEDLMAELNGLIGLRAVKAEVREVGRATCR